MKEWGIPFHIIEENWTDRQFFAMVECMHDRRKREDEANKRARGAKKKGAVTSQTYRTSSIFGRRR